jgi:hypothetical protein
MAMRLLPTGVCGAALLLAATPGALAQAGGGAPAIATVTCGDISDVPPDYQAALVYYAAGYREGVNFGLAAADRAASTASSEPAGPVAAAPSSSEAPGSSPGSSAGLSSSASAAKTSEAGAPKIVGGLTLQAQEIIDACGAAPDVLLTDIISNHGGATGFQGSPSAGGIVAGGGGTATSSSPPTGASTQPGSSALSNSGTDAVSNDLNAAGGQFEQNLQSAPPIGGTATAPAPGTTAPAPGGTGAGTTTP